MYLLFPSLLCDQALPDPSAMSALHEVAILALLLILSIVGALPSSTHDIRKQYVTEDADKHVERSLLGAKDDDAYVPTRACSQCDHCKDKGSPLCKYFCKRCPQNVTMEAGSGLKFRVAGDTLATLNSSQGLTVNGKFSWQVS